MSYSKASLENNNIGKGLLRGMVPMLTGRRVTFEADRLGGFISTRLGRIDNDVLAAVFDQAIKEIQKFPALLLTRDPERQFHITAVLALRNTPDVVDMGFLEQLTSLVLTHLKSK